MRSRRAFIFPVSVTSPFVFHPCVKTTGSGPHRSASQQEVNGTQGMSRLGRLHVSHYFSRRRSSLFNSEQKHDLVCCWRIKELNNTHLRLRSHTEQEMYGCDVSCWFYPTGRCLLLFQLIGLICSSRTLFLLVVVRNVSYNVSLGTDTKTTLFSLLNFD